MAIDRLSPVQNNASSGIDRLQSINPTDRLSITPEKKPGVLSRLGSSFVQGAKQFGSDIANEYTGIKNDIGKIGGAVGKVFGGAVAAVATPVANKINNKPLLQDIGKNIVQNAQETGEAGKNIFQGPIGIAEESAKTGLALGKFAWTGDESAYIDRMADVFSRNANLGQQILGRPEVSKEEAKQILLSGEPGVWNTLKDPAVLNTIGGMGLDLSPLAGMANKALRPTELTRPTGEFADMTSPEFARRVGINPETAPSGIVRVEPMERTPMARATGPLSEIMNKDVGGRATFKPVEALPEPEGKNVPQRTIDNNSFTETRNVVQSAYENNKTLWEMPQTTEGQKQALLQSMSRGLYAQLAENPSFKPGTEFENDLSQLLKSSFEKGKIDENALRNLWQKSTNAPSGLLQPPTGKMVLPETSSEPSQTGSYARLKLPSPAEGQNFTLPKEREPVSTELVTQMDELRNKALDKVQALGDIIRNKEVISEGDNHVTDFNDAKQQIKAIDNVMEKIRTGEFKTADLQAINNDLVEVQREQVRQSEIIQLIPAMTAPELDTKISSYIDDFRRKADLMASNEGAGVRSSPVYDAVGNFKFLANYFNEGRARADMYRRAASARAYAKEILYENDPIFKEMVDKRETLIDQTPYSELVKMDQQQFDAMFNEIGSDIKSLQKYETTKSSGEPIPVRPKSAAPTAAQNPAEVRTGETSPPAIQEVKQSVAEIKQTQDQILEKLNEIQGNAPTQKEIVAGAIKETPKTIKQISEETKILEPNVRRILGVGAKEGTFTRVEKGVYILSKDGQDLAYIQPGNALEILPKLVQDGFKADMVFLDIPYDAAGNKGGNRMSQSKGTLYKTISPDEFNGVVSNISKMLRADDSPVIFMFSQSKSSIAKSNEYASKLLDAGFKPLAKGDYYKMTKKGTRFTMPMRKEALPPEGIIVFNKTGQFDFKKTPNLQFYLVRPRGYLTEKPAELLKQLIEMTTSEGEMVLDPFAGSGVAGEQAVKSGRKAYLIEENQKAVEQHIKPRLERAADQQSLFARFGKKATPAEIKDQNGQIPISQTKASIKPKFSLSEGEKKALDFNVSKDEAKQLLLKIFPEQDVNFFTSGDLGTINGKTLLGDYADSIIRVLEDDGKVPDRVLYHEAFHQYLDMYVPEAERNDLLREANIRHAEYLGKEHGGKNARYNSEELLADMFGEYASGNKTFVGKLRQFFMQLVRRVREWMGKRNEVMDMWDEILAGKAKKVPANEPTAEPAFKLSKKNEITPTSKNLFEQAKGKTMEEFVKVIEEDKGGIGDSVDYAPWKRTVETSLNDTPLTDFGFKPTDKVTIYRGVDRASQKDIVAGDYVATSEDLAKSYTGGRVIKKEVPASSVRFASGDKITPEDFKNGFNETHLEAVYSPDPLITKSQLKQIWKEANKNKFQDTESNLPYTGGFQSRIGFTFKEMDAMWQKAIGNKVWESLTKSLQKGVQKIGESDTKTGTFFKRMVAPKQFQPELYKTAKNELNVEIQKAADRAMETGQELAQLSEPDQLEVVQRILEGQYDDSRLGKVAEKVEQSFMDLGEELVRQGKLSQDAFVKSYGKYFPRMYTKYEGAKIDKIIAKVNKVKTDLSYIKSRKNLPPEVREALGEIKTAPYPVAKRLMQEGIDVAKLKFLERVANEPTLSSKEPVNGWVKLKDDKKLGMLAGRYVPAAIEYDINDLAKMNFDQSDFMQMVGKINSVWKGTKTMLDTGVISSNFVSNIVLADFAGLPPQRVDIWAKAFHDRLTMTGSANEMKLLGKFKKTYVASELTQFLPEIDKLKEISLRDVKNMGDVMKLLADSVKKGWIKAGDAYGFAEEWSKTAVFKYLTEEKGWEPQPAADMAEKWLFNYGDVPPIINMIRRMPVGKPFLTFTYKALPRFAESAIRMPFTWMKYFLMLGLAGGGTMMLKKLGMSEDEFDKIKPKSAGDWLIYLGRDEKGTHKFLDLTRYTPFGRFVNPRNPLSLKELGAGVYGSLAPEGMYGAFQTMDEIVKLLLGQAYREAYFDKLIFDSSDKMDNPVRVEKALDDIFSNFTPNWVPSVGGDKYKSADYLRKAITDEQVVKKGVPIKYGVWEALGRFFGNKVVKINPSNQAGYTESDFANKINEQKRLLKTATSPAEREDIIAKIKELETKKEGVLKAIGKLR